MAMSPDSVRSEDDPSRAALIVGRRQSASGRTGLRWPPLRHSHRRVLVAVASLLLLAILVEFTNWIAPGSLDRFAQARGLTALNTALQVVQGAAALVVLVGLSYWLLRSEPDVEQIVRRASAIEGAIDSLSAGVAIFGRDDRLVACNEAYRALYPEIRHLLEPGAEHAQLMRVYYPAAPATLVEGRSVDQFIGDTLRRREPDATFIDRVRFLHGQWVMMTDCRTGDGGLISLRTVVSENELRALSVSRQRRAIDDLADLTHDWFWRTDARGCLVECSPALATALGRSSGALLGRHVTELPGFWSDEAQQKGLDERVARREPFPWFRFRVERAERQTTWLAACGKPMFDADGVFSGYYGAARDISEVESTILSLRCDEERFRALARLVTEWYWETDAALRYTLVKGGAEFDEAQVSRMIGQPFGQSAIGDVNQADRDALLARMARHEPLQRMPLRVRYVDRPDRVFEISAEPMFRGQTLIGYRGLSVDITERSALIERLTASEARFRALTELSSDWYWEMDRDFRFTRLQRGELTRVHPTHLPPSEVLGRRRWELKGDLIQPASWDEHRATVMAHQSYRDVIVRRHGPDDAVRYIASSGDPVFDASGEFQGYRGVSKDVTDQVRARESIERLATVDSLTMLANRATFDERATVELAQAYADGRRCALLFIDLDNFRLLNNGYGHRAGDEVLSIVAQRLRENIPEPKLLGRRGGDELIALVTDLQHHEVAIELARELIGVVSEPMRVLGLDLTVTSSIGVAFFPQDGTDLEGLVNAADAAMYEAKQSGRSTYALFTPAVSRRVELRLRLEQRLRKAIESQEFRLYFQPTVSLANGRIVGAEVLMRWVDAELGEVSPAEFIPIAEESGLVVGLGDWVLREACKARRIWRGMGLEVPPLAVNVAGVHLRQASYVDGLLATLGEYGVLPGEIEIEVTETGLFDTSEVVRENLVRLRDAGVKLALDDFGVGFSSLVHLRDLPIHRLKIDRSFTVECMRDARTLTIVKAVIEMARSLGIQVTAEGVETQTQQTWMQHLGCDSAQGYLFSRPLTAEEFLKIFIDKRGAGVDRSLMH